MKNDIKNKLMTTLIEEENVVAKRGLGISKFDRADEIMESQKSNSPDLIQVAIPVKKIEPGLKKTYYMSQKTLHTIKSLKDKFLSLGVESNQSKIIAAGVSMLLNLDNNELIAELKKVDLES